MKRHAYQLTITLLGILLFTIYYPLFTVHAKEATPTASTESTSSASVKSKLDELKIEIASKAAKLK